MKKAIRILLAILLICLAALTVVACKPDDPVIDPQEQCKQNGHSWEMSAKYPTCDAEGKITYTCTVCGATDERVLPPTGNHSWDAGKETTPPTCGVEGVRTYTCTECGETRTEAIPATGEHKLGEHFVEVASTCEREGSREYWLCQDCGNKVDRDGNAVSDDALVIPKLSHVYEVTDVTEPTCEETGKITYTCTVCGKASFDKEIPATGHSYGRLVDGTEATCTTPGMQAYYHCDRCGKYFDADKRQTEYDDLVIDKLQHRWVEVEGKQATCTEEGLTDGVVCEQCGVWQQPQTSIPAKGHNEQPIPAVAATCTEGGLTEGVRCADCGKILVYPKHTAALGHSYVVDVSVGDEGWIWGDDFLSATLNFVCANVGCPQPHVSVDAEVEVSSDDPDHTAYKATARYQGNTYTKEHSVNHNHTEHTYTVVEWRWDGYTSASVVLRCTVGNEQQTVAAEVTKEETRRPTCAVEGLNTYTATAQGPDGKTYTDVKQETVAVTSHNYVITHEGDAFGQHHEQCSVCGDDKQPVSCTIVENHCTVCDYTYTDDEILTALFALAQKTELPGTYKLSGTVTKMVSIRNTSKNQDVIFNMQVGGRIIYVYHAVGEGFDKVAVGSQVTIVGSMDYKNEDQHRFYDCTLTIDHSPTLTIDSSITNGKFNDLPDSVVGRTTVQFSITPDDGYYVESVKVNGETLDPVDGIYTIDVYQDTVIEVTIVEGTQQSVDYVKLTSQDLLQEGLQFIIVASDYDFAMKPYESGNNLKGISITKKGNVITVVGDVVQVVVLEQGYLPNTWALKVGNKYLCATGIVTSVNKNQLKTVGDKNADGASWKITIDSDGIATIVAQPNSGNTDAKHNVLRFNSTSGNELFNCYSPENADDQQAVSLYYKAGGTVVDPGKEMVTLTVNHDGDHGTAVGEDGKALAGSYEKGTVLKFRITPNTGWEVDEVTVQGKTDPLTPDKDGYYTVKLDNDTTIVVTYKPTGDMPTPQYVKLTSADELQEGLEFIIVAQQANVAMAPYVYPANNFHSYDIKKENGGVNVEGDGVQVVVLEKGYLENTWALRVGNAFLCATGIGADSNKLQITGSKETNGASWEITFSSDGTITVKAKHNTDPAKETRNILMYNSNTSNGNLFSCYSNKSNTLVPVEIYYKPGEVHAHNWIYTIDSEWRHIRQCSVCQESVTEACNPVLNKCICGKTYTEQEIVDRLYSLNKDEFLQGTYQLTGKVDKIDTAYDASYNNATFTMTVCGKSVQAFRVIGDATLLKSVKVGYTITVQGYLTRYTSGVYEFSSGGVLVSATPGGDTPTPQNVTLTVTNDTGKGTIADDKGTALESSSRAKDTTIKFRITPQEGWEVDSVTVNGTAIQPDNGLYTVTLDKDTEIVVTYKSTSTGKEMVTLTVNHDGNHGKAVDEDGRALSGEYEKGTELKFRINANEGWVVDKVTVNESPVDPDESGLYTVTLNAATTILVTYRSTGGDTPTPQEDEWKLVTDVSELQDGDQIIIVGEYTPTNSDVTSYYALGNTQNKNNRKAISIEAPNADGTVNLNQNVQIITVHIIDGNYTFEVKDYFDKDGVLQTTPGYLCAAGKTGTDSKGKTTYNNYLRTQTTLTNDGKWTIEISPESYEAKIKAQGECDCNILRFNPSTANNILFACYHEDKYTNQKAVKIYKFVSEEEPAHEHVWTVGDNAVTWTADVNGATATLTFTCTADGCTEESGAITVDVPTDKIKTNTVAATCQNKGSVSYSLTLTEEDIKGLLTDKGGTVEVTAPVTSTSETFYTNTVGHEVDTEAGLQSDAKGHYYKCKYGCDERLAATDHVAAEGWKYDETTGQHYHECTYASQGCTEHLDKTGHEADKTAGWQSDAQGHYYKCKYGGCNARVDEAVHQFGAVYTPVNENGKDTHTRQCSECNYVETNDCSPAQGLVSLGADTHARKCELCNDTISSTVEPHDFSEGACECGQEQSLVTLSWGDSNTHNVKDLAEAIQYIEDGGTTGQVTITVHDNRELPGFTVETSWNIVLDLQGHTYTATSPITVATEATFAVVNGTITNSTNFGAAATVAVRRSARTIASEGNVLVDNQGTLTVFANAHIVFNGGKAEDTALNNSGEVTLQGTVSSEKGAATALNNEAQGEVTLQGTVSSESGTALNNEAEGTVTFDGSQAKATTQNGVALDNSGNLATSNKGAVSVEVTGTGADSSHAVGLKNSGTVDNNVQVNVTVQEDSAATGVELNGGTFKPSSDSTIDGSVVVDPAEGSDVTATLPDNFNGNVELKGDSTGDVNVTLPEDYQGDVTIDESSKLTCDQITEGTGTLAHAWNATPQWLEWTDKNTVRVTFTCDRCGAKETYSSTDDDSKVTITEGDKQDATCTDSGYQKYQATVTGPDNEQYTSDYTETLTATGHNFGAEVQANAASCTENGNDAYKYCDRCKKYYAADAVENTPLTDGKGSSDDFTIGALGHNFETTEKTDATCTTPGNNAYKYCDRCGKYYAADANKDAPLSEGNDSNESFIIGASGHNFETTVEAKPASCTAPGNDAYKHCINCNKYYAETATKDTPESEGYEKSHFARPQLNHEYNEYPQERDSDLAFGKHQPVCSLCHTAKGDVDDCEIGTTTPNKCDVCGYTYTATEILDALQSKDSSITTSDGTLPGTYELTGIVTRFEYAQDDKYLNVWFKINGDTKNREVEAYGLNSGTVDRDKAAIEGAEITVRGGMQYYDGATLEFKDSTLEAVVLPKVQVTVTYEQSQGSVEISPALESGKVEAGTTITITVTPSEDYRVSSVTANDEKLQVAGEENKYTYRVVKDTVIKVEFVDKYAAYEDVIARFDLGDKKTGQDGKGESTSEYTEKTIGLKDNVLKDSLGGADLEISDLSKVYDSWDNNLNRRFKLGSSKNAGTFIITVREGTTKVVFYVSPYNDSENCGVTITISGTSVDNITQKTTISGGDNAVYIAVSVTIPEGYTKVKFETTSKYRCNIDKIEFYGMVTPPCPHDKYSTVQDAVDTTCTVQGSVVIYQCDRCHKYKVGDDGVFNINEDDFETAKTMAIAKADEPQGHREWTYEQKFVNGVWTHIATCSICGQEDTEKSGNCTIDDWSSLGDGQHSGTCFVCGKTATEDHVKKLTYDVESAEAGHYNECTKCEWKETTKTPHDEQLPCQCGYGAINFKVGDLQAETGYNSLEQAIAKLGDKKIIYLVKDITDTSVFAEAITQSFTLDLQNKTLTLNSAITLSGEVTIKNGNLVASEGIGTLITTSGTLTLTSVNLNAQSATAAAVTAKGNFTLTISGGYVIAPAQGKAVNLVITSGLDEEPVFSAENDAKFYSESEGNGKGLIYFDFENATALPELFGVTFDQSKDNYNIQINSSETFPVDCDQLNSDDEFHSFTFAGAKLSHTYSDETDTTCDICGAEKETSYQRKEIDELVKTAPTDTETYIVEGIWVHDNSKSELSDDQYGNGFLYDPSSGNRIEHYGMLKDEETFNSAIATWKSTNTFTNPKEFQSFRNQFEEGDKIELGVVYNSKYDNYYSFFIRRTEVKANINYEATTDFNADGGTVTIDNASKLHYGEEVTINITTQDGYKVGSVKHNDTVINAADGVYKFTVVPGPNKISVNFVEDTGGDSGTLTAFYTLSCTDKQGAANNSYATAHELTQNGISWSIEGNLDMSPWRIGGKGSVSRKAITNDVLKASIKKIEISFSSDATAKVNSIQLNIYNANPSENDATYTHSVTFSKGETVEIEIADGEIWDSCYFEFVFDLTCSTSSNQYIQITSIVFYS